MEDNIKIHVKFEYEDGKQYVAEEYAFCEKCGQKYIDIATHLINCNEQKNNHE